MIDINKLDPIEQLAFDASHPVRGAFPVAILGNLETRDFELIALTNIPVDLAQRVVARNLVFVGVVGIVNGTPKSALQVPLDKLAIERLSAAYIRIVEAGMDKQLEIDELNRLWTNPTDYDA